jgi:hypothetical protein
MTWHSAWLAVLPGAFVLLLGPIEGPYRNPLVIVAVIILCLVAYAGLRAEQASLKPPHVPRLRASLMLFKRPWLPMWQLADARVTSAAVDPWPPRHSKMSAHVLHVDDHAMATEYTMGRAPRVVRRAGVAGLGLSPGYYWGELSKNGKIVTWYRLPVS